MAAGIIGIVSPDNPHCCEFNESTYYDGYLNDGAMSASGRSHQLNQLVICYVSFTTLVGIIFL
jgi:hypothetical protein